MLHVRRVINSWIIRQNSHRQGRDSLEVCTQRLIRLANSNRTPKPAGARMGMGSIWQMLKFLLEPWGDAATDQISQEIDRSNCREHLQIYFCQSEITGTAQSVSSDCLRKSSLDPRALSIPLPNRTRALILANLLHRLMLFLRQEHNRTCSVYWAEVCSLGQVTTWFFQSI
jgi:hypothetical protein